MASLVDTSVWIDYLKGTTSRAARWLGDLAEAPLVTEPVLMEVLAGLSWTDAVRFERFADSLVTMSVDPHADYRAAADIYRDVRSSGRTIRNLNDCLIAAVCLRWGVELVHKDADFEVIAEVFPLEQVSLR